MADGRCTHGEVECDVARSTIRCRKCGAAATLPGVPGAGIMVTMTQEEAVWLRQYLRFDKAPSALEAGQHLLAALDAALTTGTVPMA